MTGKEYRKARNRLIDQYFAGDMTDQVYLNRVEALRRKREQSQQEKPNANRSVGTAGTDAGA